MDEPGIPIVHLKNKDLVRNNIWTLQQYGHHIFPYKMPYKALAFLLKMNWRGS